MRNGFLLPSREVAEERLARVLGRGERGDHVVERRVHRPPAEHACGGWESELSFRSGRRCCLKRSIEIGQRMDGAAQVRHQTSVALAVFVARSLSSVGGREVEGLPAWRLEVQGGALPPVEATSECSVP